MNSIVNGIILNPFAQAGNSQARFETFKESPEFSKLKMNQAKIFNCAHIQNLRQLKNELILWLGDLAKNQPVNIVSVGGDGMIHLLLNALMNLDHEIRQNITIGAIGTGSSNDFHKPHSTPGHGVFQNIPYRLDFEHAALFDIGIVDFQSPISFKEYFIINASLGATALGNWFFNNPDQMLTKLKKTSSSAAITYATFWALKNFRAQKIKIGFNNHSREFQVCNLGLIKNPHFTGSLFYPEAPAYNDGQFHLYVAHSLSFFQMLVLTLNLSKGKFSLKPDKKLHEIVNLLQLDSGKQDFILELDGEIFRTNSAIMKIHQQAVNLCP